MHLIELKNVAKYYRSEDNVSVGMKNISVAFDFNEFVAVTGSSGSGKTTLLNVISGLDGYEEGELYLNGEETSHYTIADWERYRAAYVGFVFQNYNIIESFTVLENVMLALDIQNYPRKERKKRALELIDKVGLTSHKNHKAAKLSGGQKQRAVIARALAKDCPIIVADEPTGNLDSESGEAIIKLLHEISANKLVIVVTHNYSQVEAYATRKIRMHDGIIVEDKVLKTTIKPEAKLIPETTKMSFMALVRFGLKNLIAQPKRFLFILILQFLVVGSLTFVYTQQVKQIREAGRTYSSVLTHVPPTRLLVQRRDGLEITEADLSYFASLSDVKEVHPRGENFFSFKQNLYLSDGSWYEQNVSFVDAASTLNKRFVKGDIAIQANEIVVSKDFNFEIGKPVYLRELRNYEYNDNRFDDLLDERFIVKGISSNENSTIYLSDDYLNNTSKNEFYTNQRLLQELEQVIYSYTDYMIAIINGKEMKLFVIDYIDETVTNEIYPGDKSIYGAAYNEPLLSDEIIDINIKYNGSVGGPWTSYEHELNGDFTFQLLVNKNPNYETTNSSSDAIIINRSKYDEICDTIFEYFAPLAEEKVVKTTSLSVGGRASGNRVIKKLDSEIYRVLYPANNKDPIRPIFVFLYTILAIIVISLVGSFLYVILHAVTKNVMTARQKDFAIYRSIGANRTDLGKLVIIEQVILSVSALIIVLVVFNLLTSTSLFIASVIDYLTWVDYLILLVMFTLFGILLGMRFNRKVFKQSVVETLSLAREDIL